MQTDLEQKINALVFESRKSRAENNLIGKIDNRIRTEELEYFDRDDITPETKLEMANALHKFNQLFFSYHVVFSALEPMIRLVKESKPGPVRILELASGSGGFAFELEKIGRKKKLNLEVTGSDIQSRYVEYATAKAKDTGTNINFRVLNAFDLSELGKDSFDIVFISQSVHHFSPGQLAKMIQASSEIATTGFVGIDGRRSLFLLSFLPVSTALFSFRSMFIHDAWVTARKLYSARELELIAKNTLPSARVSVGRKGVGHTFLNILF